MATASDEIAEAVGLTFRAIGQLVSPASLAELAGGMFGGEVSEDNRPVSPIGLANIGAQIGREGSGQRSQVISIFEYCVGCFQYDSCVSPGRRACGRGSL